MGTIIIIKGADFSANGIEEKIFAWSNMQNNYLAATNSYCHMVSGVLTVSPIGSFNIVVIPVEGFSKVLLSGKYAQFIGAFLTGKDVTNDNMVGSFISMPADATLYNAEYDIPSAAKFLALNLKHSWPDSTVVLR